MNPGSGEAEAGGLHVQGPHGLQMSSRPFWVIQRDHISKYTNTEEEEKNNQLMLPTRHT